MTDPTSPDSPTKNLNSSDTSPPSPRGNGSPTNSSPSNDGFPQSPPESQPTIRVVEVERARRHLLPFVQLTKPDYLADRFHVELCKVVEDFHRHVQRKRLTPVTSASTEIRSPFPEP